MAATSEDMSDKASPKRQLYADVVHDPVTSVLPQGDVPYADHAMDSDEAVITALGYKQEFKREFSLWTTFCVSFAVLGLLPSFASTIYYGISSLSPAFFFGFFLCNSKLTPPKEWDTQERQEWYGAGLSRWYSFSALQCPWPSFVLRCLRGESGPCSPVSSKI